MGGPFRRQARSVLETERNKRHLRGGVNWPGAHRHCCRNYFLGKLYIDGIESASTSTTVTFPWSGQGTKTVIGAYGNGQTTYDWNGKIDDMRIYNRARCPTEIQQVKSLGGTFGGVKITKWVEIQSLNLAGQFRRERRELLRP